MSWNWMCHIQLRYDEKQHNKKWQDLTWQVRMKCYSGKHQFSAIWYVMFFKKDNLTVWFSYNNHSSWHNQLVFNVSCFQTPQWWLSFDIQLKDVFLAQITLIYSWKSDINVGLKRVCLLRSVEIGKICLTSNCNLY